MKAFQLKVVIKNSKPPIWRRIIVPAGITFSQLSMILNEAMGWCGYHLFEFEFYHLQLNIIEGADDFFDGAFDCIEASETYIREYLEENDWFTYTYDLGDDWQHRVTVEKILDDYELDYPQVIKYKGDCPVEDCGGIYGYYDYMDAVNDPDYPDREDYLDWLEMQGYPHIYDMDAVNEEMKKEFFYRWGKGENRCQELIYRDHFDGKKGLRATRNDKNQLESLALLRTKEIREKMDEVLRELSQLEEDAKYWDDSLGNADSYYWDDSLKSVFEDFSKENILEMAKRKNVKGLSNCKKEKLIEKLVEHMLQPEKMENYFSYLGDGAITSFEDLLSGETIYESTFQDYLADLYMAGYVSMLENGRYVVTLDVAEAYKQILCEEFQRKREKYSAVISTLRAMTLLNGITPVSVILETLKSCFGLDLTKEKLKEFIQDIPGEYAEFIMKMDRVYHVNLWPNDRGILSAKLKQGYYIPTRKEVMDMSVNGCLSDNQQLRKMIQYLYKEVGADKEMADMAGKEIQRAICGGCTISDVFSILGEMEIFFDNDFQMRRFMPFYDELWNNSRMVINNGYTPNEINKLTKNIPLTMDDAKYSDNVISLEEARKNRVYPNDPCPCGSGKKYKHCCKNKK